MEPTSKIVQKLNRIQWRSATEITPEAEELVKEHIRKMQAALDHLARSRGLNPVAAYAETQSAGYKAEGYKDFMGALFKQVAFKGAGVREHLILAVASYYFWEEDAELRDLENPWGPLMKLFQMGYTSSMDDDEETQKITLLIGYRGSVKPYELTP